MYINNKFLIFFTLIILLPIFFYSCNKSKKCNDSTNPECSNFDHCWDKKQINADFTVKEVISYRFFDGVTTSFFKEYLPECDSIYLTAEFEPKSKNYDSIKWYIGSEVLSDRKIRRSYFPKHKVIAVKLVVYYTSFIDCTKDSGKDSLTKYLYSVGEFEEIPISGVYLGINTDEPTKPFEIEVNDTTNQITIPTTLGNFTRSGNIQNLPYGSPKNNNFLSKEQFFWGGENFITWNATDAVKQLPNVPHPDNAFMLVAIGSRNGDSIHINYSYDNVSYNNYLQNTSKTGIEFVSKTFIGKKIREY